jgi:toxin ParE1/3/4
MPYSVAFSDVAVLHLQEIEEYLAERFYPATAERFVQRIVKACLALGSAPYRGTKRDDLAEGIRTIGFERRATIYSRSGCISSAFCMGDGSSRWNPDAVLKK